MALLSGLEAAWLNNRSITSCHGQTFFYMASWPVGAEERKPLVPGTRQHQGQAMTCTVQGSASWPEAMCQCCAGTTVLNIRKFTEYLYIKKSLQVLLERRPSRVMKRLYGAHQPPAVSGHQIFTSDRQTSAHILIRFAKLFDSMSKVRVLPLASNSCRRVVSRSKRISRC